MRACACEITRFSCSYPSDAKTPAAARRFLVDALHQYGLDGLVEQAQLLVSELVTNAVVHAAPPVRMEIDCCEVSVRVAVSDGSCRMPVLRTPHDAAEGGRGVYLVDLLAARWGVEEDGVGKTVWFELDT